MKYSEFLSTLQEIESPSFVLPNGHFVPPHYHITEVAHTQKNFIDCGGTIRKENKIVLQLWTSTDVDHRLSSKKLIQIMELAKENFQFEDWDIEVEFQGKTIEIYSIDAGFNAFQLVSKQTDCLAKDKCEVPTSKVKFDLSNMTVNNSCDPDSGCC